MRKPLVDPQKRPRRCILPNRADCHSGTSIVYATDSCILGLVLYPLAGNPSESMGLIGHTVGIAQIAVSRDESRVVVCSGVDNYIDIFRVDLEHLDAADLLASREGDAFASTCILEGEKSGALSQEIVDYFSSSQLRVIPPSIEDVENAFVALGANEEGLLKTEDLMNFFQSRLDCLVVKLWRRKTLISV
jgi:hypothetical protein